MNKEIYYKNPEGQEFQAEPHVSLLHSQEFIGMWQVDLKWREDDSTSRIDAEFNFEDGMDFNGAMEDALEYGKILNVPVAQYGITLMWLLQEPDVESDEDQKKRLQFLMRGSAVKKFPTH